MDHYIRTEREGLVELLRRIDGLVLNDSEAKLLVEDDNLVRAGRRCGPWDRDSWSSRRGSMGRCSSASTRPFVLPAFPTAQVVDPTGAGDSFAGGMMGYLAEQGRFDAKTLKTAMAYGTLTASFTVEDFSLDRLKTITRENLERRMQEYRRMLSFG